MNLPERYTSEFATDEDRELLSIYSNMMNKLKESSKVTRGKIFDSFGRTIWEEDENDYLKRMEEAGYLVIR